MQADKIVKLISRTLNRLEINGNKLILPFKLPKRAVLILPDFIGDVVLLTPVIKNLRYNFGEAVNIDIVCSKHIYELLRTFPHINHFYLKEEVSDYKTKFIKQQKYDTVFIFNYSPLWAYAAYKGKAQQRISLNLRRLELNNPSILNKLITHFISNSDVKDQTPQYQIYLNTIRDLNLKIYDEKPEIILTQSDFRKAEHVISSVKNKKIMVHTGAGSPGKEWDFENWVNVVKYLYSQGYSIFATGDGKEKANYEYLEREANAKIYNLCGETSIRESIALYKMMDLVITIDSSPAHLAAVADTPNLIVLYGPTNENQWKPVVNNTNLVQVFHNVDCRPCITRFCANKKCLKQLTVDNVTSKIIEMGF